MEQGYSIIINKVAEKYAVSSIPVREALNRLDMEGLVEIIPHKGATVTVFDDKKINEVFSIRTVLEGYAARTAVNYIDEIKMEKLKEMVNKMETFIENQNDEKYGNKNKEFHRFIYKQSPFVSLYEMIFNLWDGGNWAKSVFAFQPERMRESNKEHYEILQAIEEKNEKKVEELIRKHKGNTLKVLNKISK